ncbi:hypothetical protein LCGC14_1957040 [marine sediment metagenome]|uniref:DUF3467 domain-containing protein n=1 Tax=marine sediment metagenome TaxID=412755 RepID=A0A0F9FFY0_9ZZZZ
MPSDRVVHYSDDVDVEVGRYGFILRFGASASMQHPGDLAGFDAQADIGMSAEHARDLRDALTRQLDRYREAYGAIRETPTEERGAG